MGKTWKKNETASLKRHGESKSPEELARLLGRDEKDVRSKLKELGLPKSSTGRPPWYGDPLVGRYEAALSLLQGGRWQEAAKRLKSLIEDGDLPEVSERARQMLRVCEARLEKASNGAPDPFLEAVFLKNEGRLDEALKLCSEGGRRDKDERFAFLAASILALSGKTESAVAALTRAVEMNPKNRIYAYHDPDFAKILDKPEAEALFGVP
jgi:tetratricopeptide (TPR) repeat protein